MDEIEKQIEKYERKLEEIKTLRSSLGLDGVTLNDLAYSNDAGQNSGDWRTTWPVSILPSQGVATWWRSPTPDETMMYDERQSRETEDRMERTQSRDVDASAWADEHRSKVRGRHGRHGRRDKEREHAFIEEVRQAARAQKD